MFSVHLNTINTLFEEVQVLLLFFNFEVKRILNKSCILANMYSIYRRYSVKKFCKRTVKYCNVLSS